MRAWLLPVALLVALMRAVAQGHAAETEELPTLSVRLPTRPMLCSLSGEEVRPDLALRGKPALLLFIGSADDAKSELVRFLAELQEEYAPWLSWASVVVGPGNSRELRRFHEESPLRLGYCWHDPDGFWGTSFQVSTLPAAVLVAKGGYLVWRQSGFGPEDAKPFTEKLQHLVRASILEGRQARDFKLPELGSAAYKTLADLPQQDYTLLFSLRSGCAICATELEVLLDARERHRDRLSVVTVSYGAGTAPGPPAPGKEGGRLPDLTLSDPRLNLAERDFISGVPYLLMIDAGGKVVLARGGYASDEGAALAGEIERRITGPGPSEEERARFAAFRRIRQEGLSLLRDGQPGMAAFYLERALELNPEFYTVLTDIAEAYQQVGKRRQASMAYLRYLSAEPLACDRDLVRERIRALDATP